MHSARQLAAAALRFARADHLGRRAVLETFLLDRVVRRPIVYTDDRGLRYILHPGENAGAYLAAGGNYELAEVRFCEQRLTEGGTVLDVGANIGLYTLLAGTIVGAAGHVHAFEPETRNAARLRENIALNDLANVVVVESAVFSRSGTVSLNVFDERFNAWHSLGRPSLPDPSDPRRSVTAIQVREVPAVTLDEYCSQHHIERVELLKLDVEGAEVDALLGAASLLAATEIRAVLFEVSLPQIEALGHPPSAPFDVLQEHGYRCFELATDGSVGVPVRAAGAHYANYVAFPPDA